MREVGVIEILFCLTGIYGLKEKLMFDLCFLDYRHKWEKNVLREKKEFSQ